MAEHDDIADFAGPEMDLVGFRGPLDLLLHLTQKGRLDIRDISTSDLAEQFLAWLTSAGLRDIEDATAWLVTASTLVWLKSKLLLPVENKERKAAEVAAEELAERLQRLSAVKSLVDVMNRSLRLGDDWFPASVGADPLHARKIGADLHRIMVAYGRLSRPAASSATDVPIRTPHKVVSVSETSNRIEGLLRDRKRIPFAETVAPFRPGNDGVYRRSGVAAAFVASLSLAKLGRATIEADAEGGIEAVLAVPAAIP